MTSRPRPSIGAPVSIIRSGPAPRFACDAGRHPFYGLEVASEGRLFNRALYGAERSAGNFHATWLESPELLSAPTYTLPENVWRRLAEADRLFYRLISSARRATWSEVVATTTDTAAGDAPFIRIDDASRAHWSPEPFIRTAPVTRRSDAPPTFLTFSGWQAGYALEVATSAALLSDEYDAQRGPENFFATWQVGGLLSAPAYTLPQSAWDVLATAGRLYYRLITSARSDAWAKPQATTRDDDVARAPYIDITP